MCIRERGSTFHLPIEVCDLMEALSRLRETGVKVISGCLEGSSELPAQIGRACVVIGHEARGISAQVGEASDDFYKIEIYGRAESLNASVAAGIMSVSYTHLDVYKRQSQGRSSHRCF